MEVLLWELHILVVVDGVDLFVSVHCRDLRDNLMSGEIGSIGPIGRMGLMGDGSIRRRIGV
jgi:hypothetical protein